MKIFIILALVTLAAAEWKPKSRQELMNARAKCMKEIDLPQDLKDQANRLEYPENDKMKQFVLCAARATDTWDDVKGWMPEHIMIILEGQSDLTKQEMRETLDSSLDDNSQGSSLQDWAFRNYKSMVQGRLRNAFLKLMKKPLE